MPSPGSVPMRGCLGQLPPALQAPHAGKPVAAAGRGRSSALLQGHQDTPRTPLACCSDLGPFVREASLAARLLHCGPQTPALASHSAWQHQQAEQQAAAGRAAGADCSGGSGGQLMRVLAAATSLIVRARAQAGAAGQDPRREWELVEAAFSAVVVNGVEVGGGGRGAWPACGVLWAAGGWPGSGSRREP
jgi:hypothetical protein